MELIDVLTRDGVPTGIVKPKPDVHRDGDWHRCAHVWIAHRDGRLLLQRRALVKENWPGLWDISVAGHVDAGESAVEAAIREAHEELGLVVEPAELTHIGTLTYSVVLRDDYIENEVHEVFILRRNVELAALVLDPAEVMDATWVAFDDLDRYARVPHEAEYTLLREHLQPATLRRTTT